MAKKQTLDMTDTDIVGGGFTIDFSDIKDYEPVPAGLYDAEIIQSKPGVSKAGFPKISLQWRILSGEMENRRVFHDLTFHPKALFATKAVLVGLGFDKEFKGDVDPEELIGLSAAITVAVETSDQINPTTGEPWPPRNVVKRVNASEFDATDLI